MALFWSKKPKAEKNYEGEVKKIRAKTGAARNNAKAAKTAKAAGTAAAPAVTGVDPKQARVPKSVLPSSRFDSATGAILRPHITEKSGVLSQAGVYTFVVSRDANKPSIAEAVKHLYKVTPVKVAITNLPAKEIWARGKWGTVPGIRKAVVTVKKGDKIEFV